MKKENGYTCFLCGMKFKGKPYKTIPNGDSPIKICNHGCYKDYLDIRAQFDEDIFHDEVLLSWPVQMIIEFLQAESDYMKVLKYIEESIKEFRTNKKIKK